MNCECSSVVSSRRPYYQRTGVYLYGCTCNVWKKGKSKGHLKIWVKVAKSKAQILDFSKETWESEVMWIAK